jgi:hypothetical protein
MNTSRLGMMPFMRALNGLATWIKRACYIPRLHLGLPDGRLTRKWGLSHGCA